MRPVFLYLAAALATACATTDTKLVVQAYGNILEADYDMARVQLMAALEDNPNNHYAALNLGYLCQISASCDNSIARTFYEGVLRSESASRPRRVTNAAVSGRSLSQIAAHNLRALEMEYPPIAP